MKAKVKVTSVELTHEDLVTLFSTALYGNSAIECHYNKSDYPNIKFEESDCYEDVIAKILLGGGEVEIVDNEGFDTNEEDVSFYGIEGINWNDCYAEDDGYGNYIPTYKINLRCILNGIETERGYELAKELLIDEEGDMWTAYNLLQIIVFGEEVYG